VVIVELEGFKLDLFLLGNEYKFGYVVCPSEEYSIFM